MNEPPDPGVQNEASLGRIIEDSLNEIYIFDAQTWRFLQVNRGARENLGYCMKELSGLTPVDIQPEMSADAFLRLVEPLLSDDRRKTEFQTTHRRKDGSCYFAEVHLQHSTYHGIPVLVAIVLDITDRRRTEELLRVQQRAIEAASCGILITDAAAPDNPIVICNRAFYEITGYTCDEVIGLNCRFLQRDDQDQPAIDLIRQAIASKRECRVLLRNYRKDGSMFWNDLQISPIHDERGRVTHFLGILDDVTESQQKQDVLKSRIEEKSAQLQAAESELSNQTRLATLGQAFGGIAHEIKNPLNAIKTSAYFLLNAHDLSERKAEEHLERIDRQVGVIDSIVNALSDVARLPKPKLSPVSLSDWVPDAANEISLAEDIQVVVDLPSDLPDVLIDVNQVSIALKNLIRNARDAMPDGGTITITAQADDEMVSITVADTGEGIAEEDLPKIMEPLYSTKPKGMGLGLAISRAIIEGHDGTITAQSALGEGTTFEVKLKSAGSA